MRCILTILKCSTSSQSSYTLKNSLSGEERLLNLMFLDENAILYIVYIEFYSSAAGCLKHAKETFGRSVEGIWKSYLAVWCTIYIEYSCRMRTDQRFVTTSKQWKETTNVFGFHSTLFLT